MEGAAGNGFDGLTIGSGRPGCSRGGAVAGPAW
jgi:hypothetical protein